MNLVIDIGNTSCKVASYEALTLKSVQRFEDPSDLQAKTGSGYDTIVLASVRNEDRSLRSISAPVAADSSISMWIM